MKKPLAIALSGAGRGLMGRDYGCNVNNAQYKPNRIVIMIPLLYNEYIVTKIKKKNSFLPPLSKTNLLPLHFQCHFCCLFPLTVCFPHKTTILLTSVSQVAGIIGVFHHSWPLKCDSFNG
jgi:hypothetical protein